MKKILYKIIWKICGISSATGNAVMDILGDKIYEDVMRNH